LRSSSRESGTAPKHLVRPRQALELLAALENARDALLESRQLNTVVGIEDQIRRLSRRLDFEDPEGDADAS
jgi:hypothetical protein